MEETKSGIEIYVLEEISNKEIEVRNNIFYVKVKANRSAGYFWEVNFERSNNVIVYDGGKPIENKRKEIIPIVGAAVEEYHVFRVVGNGKVTVVFKYGRPWGNDIEPIERISFKVVVKNHKN